MLQNKVAPALGVRAEAAGEPGMATTRCPGPFVARCKGAGAARRGSHGRFALQKQVSGLGAGQSGEVFVCCARRLRMLPSPTRWRSVRAAQSCARRAV